jgi:hypothetical protein
MQEVPLQEDGTLSQLELHGSRSVTLLEAQESVRAV